MQHSNISKQVQELFEQLQARIAELTAENERLSKELARLRANSEKAPDWVHDPERHPEYPFK